MRTLFIILLPAMVAFGSVWALAPARADTPPAPPGREALALPHSEIVSCDSSAARSRCADGTCSTSVGQGTCSSHGGVVGSVNNEPRSESIPIQPTATSTPVIIVPAPTLAPPAEVPPPAPAPTQAPVIQPASPSQMPASGAVAGSQSVPARLAAGLSVLMLMAVAAVREFKKR